MMIKWSDRALGDLIILSEIIEEVFGLEQADKIIDQLVDYIEKTLAHNKLIGVAFEANSHYRYLVFRGNKIFYTPYEDTKIIYIVHIQARRSKLKIE
jgi:plasmid stabilization system protein ParE